MSRLPDRSIGRFGWKAQTASLKEFVLTACAVELGLEVPDHPQGKLPYGSESSHARKPGLDLDSSECDALIAFVRNLQPPSQRRPSSRREAETIRDGKKRFEEAGCAICHRPKLGSVADLYSDLLLHDMGSELADNGVYGNVPSGPGPEDDPDGALGIAGVVAGAVPNAARAPAGCDPTRMADAAPLGVPRFRALLARRPRRQSRGGGPAARWPGRPVGSEVLPAQARRAAPDRVVPQVADRAAGDRPGSGRSALNPVLVIESGGNPNAGCDRNQRGIADTGLRIPDVRTIRICHPQSAIGNPQSPKMSRTAAGILRRKTLLMIDRTIDRRSGVCLVRIAILAIGSFVIPASTGWFARPVQAQVTKKAQARNLKREAPASKAAPAPTPPKGITLKETIRFAGAPESPVSRFLPTAVRSRPREGPS